MTMSGFIKSHRDELDRIIATTLRMKENPRPTDLERRLWVLNDERLYQWARSEGVTP